MRLDELDLGEAVLVAQPRRLLELLVRHVHADDAAGFADQHRRAEDVGPRARAEVEHGLARLERREVEVVPHTREGRERLGGDPVEQRGGIAERLGHGPADVEVELGVAAAGDTAVHVLDFRLQALGVHERAGVELREGLRECEFVGHAARSHHARV